MPAAKTNSTNTGCNLTSEIAHRPRGPERRRPERHRRAHVPSHGIDADQPLIIDVDAILMTAHSDKEGAASTFKRGFGHHPLWSFVDHGPCGTGEPLSVLLRPGLAHQLA